MDAARVAVERNQDVVPRRTWAEAKLGDGDKVEIVAFVGGGSDDDALVLGGRRFKSRLLVGTGKFETIEQGREAILRSGADIVTVALRRVDMTPGKPNVLDTIDRKRHVILPNTAGCYTPDEAVRTCRLARELGMDEMVKLEVIGDQRTLFPDGAATLEAAKILVKEGFTVLPYINADPVLAKRLQDVGTATVMPLGSPIGSNRGIETRAQIEIIIEQATVPVVVDAGLGAPSQAAEALEMGADAVLVNTAIAIASDPVRMAHAFRKAVEAGRDAREIGLAEARTTASATSPLTAFFSEGADAPKL
jgi:thiazole synthase